MSTHAKRARGAEERRDHYADITARVVAALEAGTVPWRRPWDPEKAGGPSMPRNAITGARYRGINVLALGMSPLAFASHDPRWATYRQAAARGWQVRGGERGTTAYFFKRLEVRDAHAEPGDEDATRRIPLMRAFTLFHASQIDGVPEFVSPTLAEAPWRAPDAVETIIARSGIAVRIGGDRAFYSPGTDHIQMPPKHAFANAEAWSSVIIHEAGHATSARHRLDRDLTSRFGSHVYAREEIRVEISQAMVCGELGIACDFPNTVAYLVDWLQALKNDHKELFRAAADAQRIADYLLAFHPDFAAQDGRPEAGDEGSVEASDQASGEAGPALAEAA